MREGRETRCKHMFFHAFLKLVSQVRFLPGVLFFTAFYGVWAFSPKPHFTCFGLNLVLISDKTLTKIASCDYDYFFQHRFR